MSIKPSTKIDQFMTPGLDFQALGQDQYDHIVQMFQILKQNSSLPPYMYLKNSLNEHFLEIRIRSYI